MPDSSDQSSHPRLAAPVAADATPGSEFTRLVEIMRALRSPEGCPWDREQSPRSLARYVLEEAHEVVDAIERDDVDALCEELGDDVFEAVFLAQIFDEAGRFTIADALRAINEKLVRRHPHVFAPGGDPTVDSAERVLEQWEVIKARERRDKGAERVSVLDGLPVSSPALSTALEIGKRVAKVNFDWPDTESVHAKIREEVDEIHDAVARGDASHVAEEVGDMLFAVANLARKLGVDPEGALRNANRKFCGRFREVEARVAAEGRDIALAQLHELEAHWQAVKRAAGSS